MRDQSVNPAITIDDHCLDDALGLARCLGNRSRYRQFLADLLEDPGYSVLDLAAMVAESPQDARQRCHLVQGIASTLGAVAFHKSLVDLENAIERNLGSEHVYQLLLEVHSAREQLAQRVRMLATWQAL